jgi:hypothetical protein
MALQHDGSSSNWRPLKEAVEVLSNIFADEQQARRELVKELIAGRLTASARRWIEEGPPKTYREREQATDLGNGRFKIPAGFWQFQHASEETNLGGDIIAATSADWKLMRFRTAWSVEGDRPGWSDRWGARKTGEGARSWIWTREAIGIEVDRSEFEGIISAYALPPQAAASSVMPSPAPANRKRGRGRGRPGYHVSDEPLIRQGSEMIDSGEAKSANDAAQKLAPFAKGASETAIITRLGKAIRAYRLSVVRTFGATRGVD